MSSSLSLLHLSPSLSKSHLFPTKTISVPKYHLFATKKISVPKPLKPISAVYSPTPFTDRLISAGSYTLPLLNSLSYGRFLFAQYPAIASLISPIAPLLNAYRSVPYASFVAFFALYLAVARNTSLSHFVRFNAMQALMLDVALVIPQLVIRIVGNPGRGVGYKLMVMGHNAVFVFMIMCFVYSFVSSVLGKTPYLPLVADAAGRQLPQ